MSLLFYNTCVCIMLQYKINVFCFVGCHNRLSQSGAGLLFAVVTTLASQSGWLFVDCLCHLSQPEWF